MNKRHEQNIIYNFLEYNLDDTMEIKIDMIDILEAIANERNVLLFGYEILSCTALAGFLSFDMNFKISFLITN